jgi:3-deoxy-manno-octulosonate cytidylyltransferase (CMP-KDO synthetase)
MTSNPNTVGIIPARYASTRLPVKPLVDLCGKPMIQHVFERAASARLVSRIIVATDHEDIVAAVRRFGGEAVMTPSDMRSGSDRVACVARRLSDAEIIINIQGDEPLLAPEMMDQTVRPLLDDSSVLVTTPIKRITSMEDVTNPSVVKVVVDTNGDALYFSRSPIPHCRDGAGSREGEHEVRQEYFKHIGVYAFRRDFLLEFASWDESVLERAERLEQLRILERGYRIRTVETEFDCVSVDTPSDAERVRQIMEQQL